MVVTILGLVGAAGRALPSRIRRPLVVGSLSIVFIPRVVRVAEAATVQVKGLEYIAAARASAVWEFLRWPGIFRAETLPVRGRRRAACCCAAK